jgi:hypothetical protein
LADALIEARSASPARPAASADSTDTAGKPEYTVEGCREWLNARVENWPKDVPPPSGEECLAAAREHFAGDIPRDEFRAIRREVVPAEWQKPGPRGPRN